MKYLVAVVVALLAFSIVAGTISVGAPWLWFTLTQSQVDASAKANYLAGMFASLPIQVTASAVAALVSGGLFARIGKVEQLLPALLFSLALGLMLAADQGSLTRSLGIGVVVALGSTLGAWLSRVKAAAPIDQLPQETSASAGRP